MSQDCCFVTPSFFYFLGSENSERNGSYYFTYFTQYSNNTSDSPYYEAGFFISNSVLACLLNSLILFSTSKELRNVSNVFIFNMHVADLVVGLIGPFMAVVRLNGDWNLESFMCHLVFYVQTVCASVVSWSIVAVAFDRYFHIVHPMRSHVTVTVQQAAIIVGVIWLLSLILMSPLGIFFRVVERPIPYTQNDVAHICTLFWPEDHWLSYNIVSMFGFPICVFILPAALMMWCYFKCVRHMKNISKSITMRMDSIGSHSSVLNIKRRRSIRDYRVIRTFMIILCVYILAWTPLFVVLLLILGDLFNNTTKMPSEAFVWAVALANFNALSNAVIYGLSMRDVRTSIIRRFQRIR